MSSQVEEQKEGLLIGDERDGGGMNFSENQRSNERIIAGEDDDLRPSSSRVKKVLNWDGMKFDMDAKHKKELRDHHIKNEHYWKEFEDLVQGFPTDCHPSVRTRSCCMWSLLWTVGSILLLAIFYLLFIILQLALFNLIMLVVMGVLWYKISQIFKAVITRVLDNGRKKPFKSYIRKIKELKWLQDLSIEIQENDEGKWIEIHLNEAADDRDEDDAIKEEDED